MVNHRKSYKKEKIGAYNPKNIYNDVNLNLIGFTREQNKIEDFKMKSLFRTWITTTTLHRKRLKKS